MFNSKVYVVTSPEMVNAVNRNSKRIPFNPFMTMVGKRITGHDEATSRIIQHNLNGEQGPGYVIDLHHGIVPSLAPGKELQHMTGAMLLQASPYLEALQTGSEVNLYEWVLHMFTMSSTRAVYGPNNPFNANPAYVRLFWEFDNDLNLLMADLVPSMFAPKGYSAREELAIAFQAYFERYDSSDSQNSAYIKARYASHVKYHLTSWNQGRLEVGSLLGVLVNSVPATSYMLVHIYSDPELLTDIRTELGQAGFLQKPEELAENPQLLMLSELCPLLHSTWQELLRVHALGPSSRYVLEDVVLEDQFLLKKDTIVQIPMAVMHNDSASWGSNVKDFQATRFLKQAKSSETEKSRQNLSSYRPFGGGASLCPGRHFVTLETEALTACMVSMFDIGPTEGPWIVPRQKQKSMATNVFPPETDIRVKINTRKVSTVNNAAMQ